MARERRPGMFEGQSQSRESIADRVATYGLKVYCTDCGLQHRYFTGRGQRLREIGSACCAARLHPARWNGWAAWRLSPRDSRREEPTTPRDERIQRVGRDYFMSGCDS